MRFISAVTLIAPLTILAACDQQKSEEAGSSYGGSAVATEAAAPAEPMAAPPPPPVGGIAAFDGSFSAFKSADTGSHQKLTGEAYVYDHNMTISMSSAFIKARFERARERCQNDAALKCKITSASFEVLGEPNAPLPVARLSVALPHDSVAKFQASLLEGLPSEDQGDVHVKAQNTTAQNVTNQVRDIEARLAQLRNYRERMLELSKRQKSTTDDLIKIEAEISRTQAEIEQIEGQQRDLDDRIAKENLSISFEAHSTASDAFQPVREVWQDSWKLLATNAASVLALFVGIIPWIPLLLGAYFGFRFLWRRASKHS